MPRIIPIAYAKTADWGGLLQYEAKFQWRVGPAVPLRAASRTVPRLTDAGLVAIQAFGGEIVEIALKVQVSVGPEIVQKGPRVDSGAVHVIEPDSHRIVSDGIDGKNGNMALAADSFPLRLGMTPHFRRWTSHTEQFGRQTKGFAVVERNA